MKGSYTRQEFMKEYNDQAITDFFKHIDRKTIGVDFFDFFGIDKSVLKADNDYHYSIPFEVAPLLAGMIRAFKCAYGKNQQGRAKGSDIKVSYERYHKYVSKMQEEVDRLEPYQQALIKNFHSYDNAKIIDLFLPMVLERISILMVLLFCHSSEQTSDNFIEIIHLFDKMIDGLLGQCAQQPPSPQNISIFTFNDAISSVFHILANPSCELPSKNQVNSVELLNSIQKALMELPQDVGTNDDVFRKSSTEKLNKAYEAYQSTHQDIIKLHHKNIESEVQAAKDRSSTNINQLIKSKAERAKALTLHLLQRPVVYQEVERIVKIRNGFGEYSRLKGKFSGNKLNQEAYETLSETDQTIYECYKLELSRYETTVRPDSKEYYEFIEQRTIERINFIEEAAQQQAELQQAALQQAALPQELHRSYLNELYQKEKGNEQYQAVIDSLSTMATKLLTHQLKSQ